MEKAKAEGGLDDHNSLGVNQEVIDAEDELMSWMDREFGSLKVNLSRLKEEETEIEVDESFPGHKGRKGKVGGSLPKGAVSAEPAYYSKISGIGIFANTSEYEVLSGELKMYSKEELGLIKSISVLNTNTLYRELDNMGLKMSKTLMGVYDNSQGAMFLNRDAILSKEEFKQTFHHEFGHAIYFGLSPKIREEWDGNWSNPKFDRFTKWATDNEEGFAETYMAAKRSNFKSKSKRYKKEFAIIKSMVDRLGLEESV